MWVLKTLDAEVNWPKNELTAIIEGKHFLNIEMLRVEKL